MQEAPECCISVGWHREMYNGEDAWIVAAAQRAVREPLSVAGRASTSKYISSPTERSVGIFCFCF